MSRRSEPRLKWTEACGRHRPYRSRHEAQAKASWHPAGACAKCRAGRIWHVFPCGDHFHMGHTWSVAS